MIRSRSTYGTGATGATAISANGGSGPANGAAGLGSAVGEVTDGRARRARLLCCADADSRFPATIDSGVGRRRPAAWTGSRGTEEQRAGQRSVDRDSAGRAEPRADPYPPRPLHRLCPARHRADAGRQCVHRGQRHGEDPSAEGGLCGLRRREDGGERCRKAHEDLSAVGTGPRTAGQAPAGQHKGRRRRLARRLEVARVVQQPRDDPRRRDGHRRRSVVGRRGRERVHSREGDAVQRSRVPFAPRPARHPFRGGLRRRSRQSLSARAARSRGSQTKGRPEDPAGSGRGQGHGQERGVLSAKPSREPGVHPVGRGDAEAGPPVAPRAERHPARRLGAVLGRTGNESEPQGVRRAGRYSAPTAAHGRASPACHPRLRDSEGTGAAHARGRLRAVLHALSRPTTRF